MKSSFIFAVIVGFTCLLFCPVIGKESWGYIEVRKDAHMFWWLYTVNASGDGYTSKPLVIWLQGGPGSSSTGFGNFMEIGPLDINMKPRKYTWMEKVNLLFIDNPVGAGFSYVTNKTLLCKNNEEIATDLVTMIKSFLEKLPEFKRVPLYIFSESYGGKMAAQFALQLQKEIKAGKIQVPLKGVALGDSWISPIDSVLTWSRYLLDTSFVYSPGFEKLESLSKVVRKAVDAGNFTKAAYLWGQLESLVSKEAFGVSFYNILYPIGKKSNASFADQSFEAAMTRMSRVFHADVLSKFMNTVVRDKLTVIPKDVKWGGQAADVFTALTDDFMRPVTKVVEELLNATDLSVVVYNGQLDLIVDVIGTLNWVHDLRWPGSGKFSKAEREPIYTESGLNLIRKRFKNLSFYWLLHAGHMVPMDNPEAAFRLLEMAISK